MYVLGQTTDCKLQMQTIAVLHASLNPGALERKHRNAQDMHVHIGTNHKCKYALTPPTHVLKGSFSHVQLNSAMPKFNYVTNYLIH